MDFVEEIYKRTKMFPVNEQYGLSSQLRRAATSVTLNIAEGSGSDSDKEFNRFLSMAMKSSYEVMCAIEIAKRLKYCDEKEADVLQLNCDEISAMITGLKKRLRATNGYCRKRSKEDIDIGSTTS